MSDAPPRIVVAGAGAIGLYVGGHLVRAGHDVTFLGRARIQTEIDRHGLTLTDFTGRKDHLRFRIETDPACLKSAEIVLVAVKSAATAEIGLNIADHAPDAAVISLQNGISNPAILRTCLPSADVRGGMVPFNVARTGLGHFHRGTSGDLIIEAGPRDLARVLSTPELPWRVADDFEAVQWGKLLVNLNNALNALSGLTLLEQLQDRDWRRLLAAQMTETLDVLKQARIRPAKFAAVAPQLVPHILRLPTPLFRRLAKAMLTIDPQARSSMQDDLEAGRKTEIGALQGEVQALARKHGVATPTIDRVIDAIRQAEAAGSGAPRLAARDV